MWCMTCDTWYVTCDTWYGKCDTWNMTHGGGWKFSQNFSSLAFLVWAGKWFEDLEEKYDSISEWTDNDAVYQTAPATPGLLKLEVVGPVDNRPSTNKLHHFFPKKIHVTHDMCHVTHNMWQVTRDMWHVVAGEHSIKISARFWFVIYDILKIWWKKMTCWLNWQISDKVVSRTAPATPSLFNKYETSSPHSEKRKPWLTKLSEQDNALNYVSKLMKNWLIEICCNIEKLINLLIQLNFRNRFIFFGIFLVVFGSLMYDALRRVRINQTQVLMSPNTPHY